MYLGIPPQPDCATAWLKAARAVDAQPRHEAYNVILDIEHPCAPFSRHDLIFKEVDLFLRARNKSLVSIANTIFPAALYRRYGSADFIDAFRDRILPRVRRGGRWSGYYFDRMTDPDVGSGRHGPLGDIIQRMADQGNPSRNKFELSIFDAARDVDDSPYGGQCLSFLSFKVHAGDPEQVSLTAIYRNHYYIEKLLGNLIGLGQLLHYVASETALRTGSLTVLSTHAQIDMPNARRSDIQALFESCEAAKNGASSAHP
jgi:hypothetical protein